MKDQLYVAQKTRAGDVVLSASAIVKNPVATVWIAREGTAVILSSLSCNRFHLIFIFLDHSSHIAN